MPHGDIPDPGLGDLPIVIPANRLLIDLSRSISASGTEFFSTNLLAPRTILRAFYFVSEASGVFARFLGLQLATVKDNTPSLGDFAGAARLLPGGAEQSTALSWTAMPHGSGVWTPLNMGLPNQPNRIGARVVNLNALTVEIQLKLIVDNPVFRSA